MQRRIVHAKWRLRAGRLQSVPAVDAFEVRVEPLRGRQPLRACGLQTECPMEKSSWTTRVDNEPRDDSNGAASTCAFEGHAGFFLSDALKRRLVQVNRTRFGLTDQGRDRSPAGTNACLRYRRADSRRPGAAAHGLGRLEIVRQDGGRGR